MEWVAVDDHKIANMEITEEVDQQAYVYYGGGINIKYY
jgi:hypothetical protein